MTAIGDPVVRVEDKAPHVELVDVGKTFGGAEALKGVWLRIGRGTVHGLVGENGAGKSTLGKIIAGALRPDHGEVRIEGQTVDLRSPRDALGLGIAAIQQEITLLPRRSVLDNVFLGMEPTTRGGVDGSAMRTRFEELDRASGFGLPPESLVSSLTTAEQQKVEVLRALARDSQLIIMDEPTARLSSGEAARLLEIVRDLRRKGVTVVYVSHFLEEVLEIADLVTVMRNGSIVETARAEDRTPDALVTAMLGHPASLSFPEVEQVPSDASVVLSVRGLTRRGAMHAVSFDIRAGEILGLAGLVGSGRSEVARAIFGADHPDSGVISVGGVRVEITSPRRAVRAGIAMLPESRKDQGLVMRQSVGANVTLPHLDRVSAAGVIDRSREKASVSELLQHLDVRPPVPGPLVESLSGGNQQRVLFAKWLYGEPLVLLADEPTRGVDVGAKRAIYELISRLARNGMAVLLISSEIEEVLGLAHRVLVMRRGRTVAEFAGEDLNEDLILRTAFGSESRTGGEVA